MNGSLFDFWAGSVRSALPGAFAAAALLGTMPGARAEVVQIAAPAFTVHCPCTPVAGDTESIGSVEFNNVTGTPRGLLQNAQGRYYAAVPFPRSGHNVCRFSLVYRDNDADHDVTARLLKKAVVIGGQTTFDDATVMARVRSAGAAAEMRRKSTRKITEPGIDTADAFYFVELELPENLIEVVGVQVEVKKTCS